MSASVSGMPGGQPSTTQPIAGPWLSPKVVTRNIWPNVLNDILLNGLDFTDCAVVVAPPRAGVKWLSR